MDTTKHRPGRFVFGPVPSRRLGRSLGVDLVPFKTCSYDCVYCQLGRTTVKTCEQKVFCPVDEVLAECAEKLGKIPRPDYITLSGSGEPTLHKNLGDIVSGIKRLTDIPVAVLTNGSLFWKDEVRRMIMEADLLIPSLDAGNEEDFIHVNRPHGDISFTAMVEGLCLLRDEYRGPMWLEVFLVNNLNTGRKQLERIKAMVGSIDPERIQLNTAVRGAAEDFVEAVSMREMAEICRYMGPRAEIIAHGCPTTSPAAGNAILEDVLNLLVRRPCTIDDISRGLNIHRNEAIKHVHALREQSLVSEDRSGHAIQYYVREPYLKET